MSELGRSQIVGIRIEEFLDRFMRPDADRMLARLEAIKIAELAMRRAADRDREQRIGGTPAERPADKIAAGLKDAISATRLANTIIALLPPDTATPDLQNQIICALAPHVSHTAADFQRGETAE